MATAAERQRRARQKQGDDSPGISITVGDKTYTVRQSDVSAHDARALRQETGFSWAGLLREAEKDLDIDLLAALVWFARRLDGDTVSTYDSVLDEVGYDTDMSITLEDKRGKADEGDDSPEV